MNTIRNTVARKGAWLSTFALVAAMQMGVSAFAQATPKPPERMTYQGFIAGSDGVALATAAPKNYDVIFRIYDAESGGVAIWGEQQTVTVDKGYFSVLLGEGAAVNGIPNAGVTLSSLFDGATASDRYVAFTVKGIGTGGADVDILPRVRLMTSPYAFLASRALFANNAATADVAALATSTSVATNAITATNAFRIIQATAPNAELLGSSGTNLVASAPLLIKKGQHIQFGSDVTNRESVAGQIAYQKFTPYALEIVGAATSGGPRYITMYADSANGTTAGGAINFMGGNFNMNGYTFLNGGVGINARNTMEFGYGVTPKEVNNGKITYMGFSGDALDIVGAGVDLLSRRTRINGMVDIAGPGGSTSYTLWVHGYNSQIITIQADGIIRAGGGFLTGSDRRIKDLVGISDSQRDLENLRRIRVTDYRFKSSTTQKRRVVKGVLAQELGTVLPEAVQLTTGFIPCEPIHATKVDWKGTDLPAQLTFEAKHGLKAGDNLQLDVDGQATTVSVREVVNSETIVVSFVGIGQFPKAVSVIGREVPDFQNVEYQDVYMTAVSALQEVDRRLQVVEQREARVAELEKKAVRLESLEHDLAELRKLVADMKASSKKATESAAVSAPASPAVASAR